RRSSSVRPTRPCSPSSGAPRTGWQPLRDSSAELSKTERLLLHEHTFHSSPPLNWSGTRWRMSLVVHVDSLTIGRLHDAMPMGFRVNVVRVSRTLQKMYLIPKCPPDGVASLPYTPMPLFENDESTTRVRSPSTPMPLFWIVQPRTSVGPSTETAMGQL